MRGRGAVLGLVLGVASSLVVEGVAVAADGAVAAPVSLEAPVGIAAVAFGAIGLVAGLVRRRRTAVVRTAANQPVVITPVVDGGDATDVRPATTGV
ncbi:hypothetical protein IOD16_32875 [Saccharothrix sp. 6-C]|uniref:Uncharacterized protein n=1 Tax=Saccharothrix texasensis TaxID=103734 RepID=A0A3N1HCL7_9PSEU|nr:MULTISPECIES: hypothetical protein [Saccharothrix]QQQ75814.1 hypothetical protein IOD16_32875 [Saccharothrix sp. 6-C]ROP40032.1 hypothetical protein EDD40_5437 [Saccharothrix texasensis]